MAKRAKNLQAPAEAGDGADRGQAGPQPVTKAGMAPRDWDPLLEEASVILQQREIERLLIKGGERESDANEGIKAILNASLVSYERLPMLDVVFERLASLLGKSLRRFAGDRAVVRLEKITSARFATHMSGVPLSSMLAVVRAEEWHNQALVTLERGLIYAVLDALLGGRQGGRLPGEARPYTSLEQNLMQRLLQIVLADLSQAFAPLSPVKFRFQRLECNPRFAAIARDVNATVVVSLTVGLGGRGGQLDLVIPYVTLEPIRGLLLQSYIGERQEQDAIWQEHLSAALMDTEVTLDAVLEGAAVSLGEVLNWQVGSQIFLNAGPESSIELRCGGAAVLQGQMRRKTGNIAIEVAGKAQEEPAS